MSGSELWSESMSASCSCWGQVSLLCLVSGSDDSVRVDGAGGGGDGSREKWIWMREAKAWNDSLPSDQGRGLSLCCVCPAGMSSVLITPSMKEH